MQINSQFSLLKEIFLQHNVSKAFLFGSYAKNIATENSDIDFLVKFNEGLDYETYSNNYFNLINILEKKLNKNVDLVAEETLSNPYLIQSINENKIQIV